MRDHDLTFPLIIGLEFLYISGMKLDFAATFDVFREGEESHYFIAPTSIKLTDVLSSATRLHAALPSMQRSHANKTMIKELVMQLRFHKVKKLQLEQLMSEWTMVFTDSLGCTSSIIHQINTEDEILVRRKAYPTLVHKQSDKMTK